MKYEKKCQICPDRYAVETEIQGPADFAGCRLYRARDTVLERPVTLMIGSQAMESTTSLS